MQSRWFHGTTHPVTTVPHSILNGADSTRTSFCPELLECYARSFAFFGYPVMAGGAGIALETASFGKPDDHVDHPPRPHHGGITRMNDSLPRTRAVWRCSGFTKKRFLRVSITSCAFLVAGIFIAAYSLMAPGESAVRLLLFAACCLLVACATVLSSILSLMFYLSRDVKSEDETPAA
jgi:hypothetical protein